MIIIIYLAGVVLSYVLSKRACLKNSYKWTKGDRSTVILISLFSWITVSAHVIVLLWHLFSWDIFNDETPARW